ncbi:MAG: phosphate signaling complex protein PhoU [Pirellulaceae bacterium]
MSRHLKQDLEEAYHRLLALSGQVEDMINLAVKSLMDRDLQTASQVIALDSKIDSSEVRIEEECLKMLALHQPVAADLRRLTTMMKINNDIERMADLACNVAERASNLMHDASFVTPELIRTMAEETIGMVRDSLNAFVNLDIELAYSVIHRDQTVDGLNVKVIDDLVKQMARSEVVESALHCFSASRHLERIADHATNIAEDVVYMVNGVIVRHRHAELFNP